MLTFTTAICRPMPMKPVFPSRNTSMLASSLADNPSSFSASLIASSTVTASTSIHSIEDYFFLRFFERFLLVFGDGPGFLDFGASFSVSSFLDFANFSASRGSPSIRRIIAC